ncbi:formate dehydrogenase accessory sulfurtransferase FdhD [Meiothermus rufus]|uniref:formate dehydrogenase accessory sulfurtransferase FdhD n=1 Tax=Meiothermus rufus TaxID=604332 RepID=UPI000485ACBC|nr:formate dehydrogenase accessory sulfurtransferase FdhD [Meiothermus rufus]
MSTSTSKRPKAKTQTTLWRVEKGRATPRTDLLATEEPLEIRLAAGGEPRPLAVVMRTPGHDFELAAGFLFAEGLIKRREDIRQMRYCPPPGEPQQYNSLEVRLNLPALPSLAPLERAFYTSAACGVCGKATLENLERHYPRLKAGWQVPASTIAQLPQKLLAQQGLFAQTGGLHAAALFDPEGRLLALREDVGRHNALDKLIGWALLEGRLPLSQALALVSGRASYELVQKTLAAGIPLLAAISAPSSLAVALAQRFGLTLVGFLRGSFNIYTHPERIQIDA